MTKTAHSLCDRSDTSSHRSREVAQIVDTDILAANRFERATKRVTKHLVDQVAATARRWEQQRFRTSINERV